MSLSFVQQLFLVTLFSAACLGTESRLDGPSGPAASVRHSLPQVLPQPQRFSLSGSSSLGHLTRGKWSCLTSGQYPSYVILNGDVDTIDPVALLSPSDGGSKGTQQQAADEDAEPLRVFSFWQWPQFTLRPGAATSTGAIPQTTRGQPDTQGTGEEGRTPLVLHFPAVAGGWAQQNEEAAAERAAKAGAAVTCGDLLIVPVPLHALDAPASLLPQYQPLSLLMAAVQLQLQLRAMQQKGPKDNLTLPTTLAAAASRTKPIVILLRDPAPERQTAKHATTREGSELTEAAERLRVTAAHSVLRLLEEQWKAMAEEVGVVFSGGNSQLQTRQDQPHLQRPQEATSQQQSAGFSLVPHLRELFSVHVVFLPGHQETPASVLHTSDSHLRERWVAALQHQLQNLLMQHRQRDLQGETRCGNGRQKKQQQQQHDREQQQQLTVGPNAAEGSSFLHLFDAAVTACRSLVAAPESTRQAGSAQAQEHHSPALGRMDLAPKEAVAFDAEVYRRRAIGRWAC